LGDEGPGIGKSSLEMGDYGEDGHSPNFVTQAGVGFHENLQLIPSLDCCENSQGMDQS
jgi:hypothetical protein